MGMFPLIYLYLIYCLAFIYCYFYYYIFIYYCHFNFSFISTNVLPLYSSYALFVNPSLREGWFLWILWLLFTPRHSQSLLRKDLPPLRGSLLLPMRLQGALLIGCVYKTQCSYSWRSRPAFLQAGFHARQKKAHRNASYLPGNMIKCKEATAWRPCIFNQKYLISWGG